MGDGKREPPSPGNPAENEDPSITGCLNVIVAEPANPEINGNGSRGLASSGINGSGSIDSTTQVTDGNGSRVLAASEINGNGSRGLASSEINGKGSRGLASSGTNGSGSTDSITREINGDGNRDSARPGIDGDGNRHSASTGINGNGNSASTSPGLIEFGIRNSACPGINGGDHCDLARPEINGNGSRGLASSGLNGDGSTGLANSGINRDGHTDSAKSGLTGSGSIDPIVQEHIKLGNKDSTSPGLDGYSRSCSASPELIGCSGKEFATQELNEDGSIDSSSSGLSGDGSSYSSSPGLSDDGSLSYFISGLIECGIGNTAIPGLDEICSKESASPGRNGDGIRDSAYPELNELGSMESPWLRLQNYEPEIPRKPILESEKLVLEAALDRLNQNHKVKGVISIRKEQAVPKGENFLSIVTRLTVEVVLGCGRCVTRRFILKEIPEDEITRKICKHSGIFKLETNTYLIALKEMEYLMKEFRDTDDILWCQLVNYDPYSSILLEDLTDYGFKTVERQSCLDFDHGLLAIRSIGRFHAMAKVLQGRGIINENDHIPYSLINHPSIVKSFFYKGYEAVSKGIKKYWGTEWSEIADKLRLPLKYLQDKMLDIGKLAENRFNVLNHGDFWSNNLMFKYDFKNKPIAVRPYSLEFVRQRFANHAVSFFRAEMRNSHLSPEEANSMVGETLANKFKTIRFLDFQAPHYNSPAIDLTYFLHQSMEPSVRRSRFTELIENYYESLMLTFDKYNYKGQKLTFEELLKEMERVSFFGLSMFTIRHAVVTTHLEDAMNLEKILVTEGEEGINIHIFEDLSLIERMGPDLKYIIEKHAS